MAKQHSETKGTLSGNSLYSLLGASGVDDERSAFHKDFKIRGVIGEKGQKYKLWYMLSMDALMSAILSPSFS